MVLSSISALNNKKSGLAVFTDCPPGCKFCQSLYFPFSPHTPFQVLFDRSADSDNKQFDDLHNVPHPSPFPVGFVKFLF